MIGLTAPIPIAYECIDAVVLRHLRRYLETWTDRPFNWVASRLLDRVTADMEAADA